jgi:RHS repeat-associated protein
VTSGARTSPTTTLRRATLVAAAALLALLLPAAAGAYAAPASQKLASGGQTWVAEANVRQERELKPVSWWGHDSLHARYYSNTLGRFVSVDPVEGKVGSSQSWNRYSYVLNNPLNLIDPLGLLEEEEPEKQSDSDDRPWGRRLIDWIFPQSDAELDPNAEVERQAYLDPEISGVDQSRAARTGEMEEGVRDAEGMLSEEGALLAAGGVGRLARVAPGFSLLRDHVRRHALPAQSASSYYNAAVAHLCTGSRFVFRHDRTTKHAFVTRTGPDSFTFTSASRSGRRIFTHIYDVSEQYLRNLGITLPKEF